MKKKVILVTVDTTLTNKEIESGRVELSVRQEPEGSRGSTPPAVVVRARNVRVVDVD